ncbi:MAG: DUF3313 domain-containing protein [Gammaproteobacteria bacterium]|nr:DUF3313 domain-containing protein [Gammaproteobacteria bacterium]
MRSLPGLYLLLVVVLGLPACSQPAVKDEVCAGFAAENLYRVQNSGFAEACARRDAALSGYRLIDIEPLGVSHIDIPRTNVPGTRPRDWSMTAERQAALQAGWADAMDKAFASHERATGGPGVLRIEAELVRIAPGRPSATTIGGELQPVGSTQDVVEISAEFRLLDAADGRLLAVIRDSRTITSVSMSRTAPATVNTLFGSWAALLHTRVTGK